MRRIANFIAENEEKDARIAELQVEVERLKAKEKS
jgi:uncharacterized small protein (DUF1192 family)